MGNMAMGNSKQKKKIFVDIIKTPTFNLIEIIRL